MMKKQARKFVSVLLTLMMLLSLLPTTALAADTITSINITGITAPKDGVSPYDLGLEGITTGTSGLAITHVQWNRGIYMQTAPFEAGFTYSLSIHFEVAEGYEVSDSVTVDHNLHGGTFSGKNLEAASPWISIDYTIPAPTTKTPITSVTVSDVTEPEIGKTPDFDITVTATGAAINNTEPPCWYKYNPSNPEDSKWVPMGADATFGEGNYQLEVWLAAEEGYEFTGDTECFFGEDKLREVGDAEEYESCYVFDGEESVGFYLYFTLEETTATTINELSATVTEPVGGHAPSLEAVAGGAGYTVEYVEWADTAEETVLYPEDGDTFEAGKQYTVEIEFEPEEGYVFAESASVVINGQPAELKEVRETSAYGTFTFTATVTPIESVKISDVTEPVVGDTPDYDVTVTGAELNDEDGYDPICWYKYNPETAGWDDMDASTPFGAGTYILEVLLKAEAGYKFTEGIKFYFGDEELPEFDGRYEHNYELDGEDYAGIYLYFTLEETVTPATYTVRFDANSGSGTMADATGVSGEYTLPACTFTAPSGKQFKAWSVGGSEKAVGEKITVSADTTVTAVWEEVPVTTYTVTFATARGTAPDAQTIPAGSKATEPTAPTEEGWTFEGWFADGGTSRWDFETDTVNADITLTAKWTEDTPALQTATIVVKKWDSNQQPLPGATFTLTKPGSIQPAYTAVSDENGLVTFAAVADGSYTLAESEAPAGYVKDDTTWNIYVTGGVAHVIHAEAPNGQPYNNDDPIVVVNTPVPAPDIVVWKTDGGQNYIAGASFALTKEGENAPAYTATSDEDGKVLFKDVADGTYILTETAAPEGYIKTDKTYKFLVENGEVSLYEDGDPVAYQNGLNIDNEPIVTVTLPITKVVVKGGTSAPGQQTFTFEIKEFGNSNYDVSLATIVENTITTNDTGSFDGVLKFTLPGDAANDILSEGIVIVEKNGGAANWTYDGNEWTAYFDNDASSGEQWAFINKELSPNAEARATFTNTYSYTPSNPNPNPNPNPAPSTPVLNKEDHNAFLQGFTDGTFRPDANMTRAQVTVMFARLLVEKMAVGATYANSFSDVPADYWAANEIGYMEKFGIITGFTDGTFRPDAPITRAQFAAIACRFEELTEGTKTFSDVPADHWAAKYISYAAERGWVSGYTDGTFRPDNYITRAEVVTVTCRLVERNADKNYITKNIDDLKSFPDVDEDYWAYWFVMEATNGHDYTKRGGVETWTGLHE